MRSHTGRRYRGHDRQRDLILRSAAQLFRDRGFTETGMRDIADAAGLSAANLYHYFNGKHELLAYCQDRALDRMLDAVAAARRASTSPLDRLQSVLTAHLQTLLDDIEGATAHVQLESLPPSLRHRVVLKRDRYEVALRRLVNQGIESGEFVDLNAELVTRAMLGAMNWTVTWFKPEGRDSAAEVGALITRFLVRGVAVRSPSITRRFALAGRTVRS